MTLLSKVNTIIEYAKYGVSMSHAHNGDGEYELYLPRSLGSYTAMSRDGDIINVVSGIKGKIFSFGSSNDNYPMFGQPNSICEIIDLPECTYNPGGWGIFSGLKALKVFRLPKIRVLGKCYLQNCNNLEIVEVGSLVTTQTDSFSNCSKIKEIIIGKDTTASLYLYHCPELTQECLHNIIDNLADMTGSNAPTFYVGEENLTKISPEYISKLNQKHWNFQ